MSLVRVLKIQKQYAKKWKKINLQIALKFTLCLRNIFLHLFFLKFHQKEFECVLVSFYCIFNS